MVLRSLCIPVVVFLGVDVLIRVFKSRFDPLWRAWLRLRVRADDSTMARLS